jgi:hypothetical protein
MEKELGKKKKKTHMVNNLPINFPKRTTPQPHRPRQIYQEHNQRPFIFLIPQRLLDSYRRVLKTIEAQIILAVDDDSAALLALGVVFDPHPKLRLFNIKPVFRQVHLLRRRELAARDLIPHIVVVAVIVVRTFIDPAKGDETPVIPRLLLAVSSRRREAAEAGTDFGRVAGVGKDGVQGHPKLFGQLGEGPESNDQLVVVSFGD